MGFAEGWIVILGACALVGVFGVFVVLAAKELQRTATRPRVPVDDRLIHRLVSPHAAGPRSVRRRVG